MTNDELNQMRQQEMRLQTYSGPFACFLDTVTDKLELEELRQPQKNSYEMDFVETNVTYTYSLN